MNFLLDVLLVLVVFFISGPGMVMLIYLWVFSGPGVLDGLPDPADKKGEDLLKEE
jgi:hypothetical protein